MTTRGDIRILTLSVLLIAASHLAQTNQVHQKGSGANKKATVVQTKGGVADRCSLNFVERELESRRMPDVRGCVYSDLAVAFERYRPLIESPEREPSPYPPNQISSQDPSPGSLLRGTRITLHISEGPPPPPVSNEATPFPTATDPDNSNQNTNTDDNRNKRRLGADLSVERTFDDAGPYKAGQSLTYTITVSNAGPTTASQIHIDDKRTNLTLIEVTGACEKLPCTVAKLDVGKAKSIKVVASIGQEGTFGSEVDVKARESDPNPSNNHDAGSAVTTAATWQIPWFWIAGGTVGAAVGLGVLTWLLWLRTPVTLSIPSGPPIPVPPDPSIPPIPPDQIRIRPSLEGPYYPGFPGTLSLTAPPIGIETHLALVDQGPDGPMPIIRTEVHDD